MNVTPSSVNAIWATTGRSVMARIASTASAISARSEKVSTTNASTPPSSSASACSPNASRPSAAVTVPSGSRYLPSGPIEPSTQTARPAEPRRVHRDVGACIVGLARAVERLDLGRGALEHRAASDARGAREQLRQVTAQPHDGPERAQRLDTVVAARQPAAGGDDVAGLEGEGPEHLALETPERLLAVGAEDVGDRAAVARDDHVVGLDEAAAEAAREQPPADRLSRAHEPHNDDVIARHVTPILSSTCETPGPPGRGKVGLRAAARALPW